MATEFAKTNEISIVETSYEAEKNSVKYNFIVRKQNESIEHVACSVSRDGVYIGAMHVQNGNKNISLPGAEPAIAHVEVLEEFLSQLV